MIGAALGIAALAFVFGGLLLMLLGVFDDHRMDL